jgi:hypothetical protein
MTSRPGEVFMNILVLKQLPAGQLRGVMGAWSRSLGIMCDHCHTPGQFEKDDLPDKQVAREMVHMTGEINTDLLKSIKVLKSESPQINCYTCHRGKVKPETTLLRHSRRHRPNSPVMQCYAICCLRVADSRC